VSENHTHGVGSLAALKIRSPSLLYFKNVSALSCPLSRIGLCNVTQMCPHVSDHSGNWMAISKPQRHKRKGRHEGA
jgi:hypothetical protein